MDLRILEIASHTENNKIIEDFTHKSKHKNPLCGDEMEISLIVKNDVIKDMGYQCKSCVYCQASVSLLSQKIKNKNLKEVSKFIISLNLPVKTWAACDKYIRPCLCSVSCPSSKAKVSNTGTSPA